MKIEDLLNKRKNPLYLPSKGRTRENLQYVVEHLPVLADLMPEIRRDFDMKGCDCCLNSVLKCSTSGCLLRHTARLFELQPYAYLDHYIFDPFTRKVFPYIRHQSFFLKWSFIFHPEWEHYQPKFDQAIARISHLLACDLEIKGFIFHQEIITT